jgi:hypothetical protein
MGTTHTETTYNAAISWSADSMLPMTGKADTGQAGKHNTPQDAVTQRNQPNQINTRHVNLS